MNTKLLVLFFLIATSVCFSQKRYFKGNTHTHSYPQSGDAATDWTSDKVIASYKAAGYDFMVFTDHGAYWYASGLSSPDFTIISGEEAGISGNGLWGHFTAMKIYNNISGSGKTHQQLLDAIAAQGGLGFLNHPRWDVIPIYAWQVINLMKQNLRYVEVYNGVTDTPTTYDTSVWDSVLTTGRLMYGVASDDAHKETNRGKGWICVYASSKNPDTLLNAIRNGDFYASNGIVLDTISYQPDKIYVRSTNGSSIRFIGPSGKILAYVTGKEATYTIKGTEGYVRAEIGNTMNQTAWIQPYMIPQTSGIHDAKSQLLPASGILFQNYPNPFNPSTAIRFRLAANSFVTLGVFDVLGREVATLVSGDLQAGDHEATWDPRAAPSGVYTCRLLMRPASDPGRVSVDMKKMLYLK